MDEATKKRWDAELARVADAVKRIARDIADLEESIDPGLPEDRRPSVAVTIILSQVDEVARRADMSPFEVLSLAGSLIARASPAPPPALSDSELMEAITRTPLPASTEPTIENKLAALIADLCMVAFRKNGGGGDLLDGVMGEGPYQRRAGVVMARAQTILEAGDGQATVVVSPTGQETTTAIVHHPHGRVKMLDCNPISRTAPGKVADAELN